VPTHFAPDPVDFSEYERPPDWPGYEPRQTRNRPNSHKPRSRYSYDAAPKYGHYGSMGSIMRDERKAAADRMAKARGDDEREGWRTMWTIVFSGATLWVVLASGYIELLFK
jgi:hypothetical protein